MTLHASQLSYVGTLSQTLVSNRTSGRGKSYWLPGPYNCLHWNGAFFFAFITKILYWTKIRLVLLFGSIYQHFTFLQIATCFAWFCC